MNAIGLVCLGAFLIMVLAAPRRWAMVGLLAGILYMTLGQWIDVGGLHIYPMRLLLLGALARVLARREWLSSPLNIIDRLLLLTFLYRTVIFLINGNGNPTLAIGVATDVLLSYFAIRGLVQSVQDLDWTLGALAVLLIPYVALIAVESRTGNNPFAFIGGLAEHTIRGDRPRCLGSFQHASLLGTFGASFLPLYFALIFAGGRHRLCGIAGAALCMAIVYFSNSGGPLTSAMLAVLGWFFWFLRKKMALVRLGIFATLVAVALTMKAPLWYLPAKMSLITGGDGWHRSYLMEVAFDNFDKWWISGMSELETAHWFPYVVASGAADIINYYLDFAIAAGVVASILFCALLVKSFSQVGRAVRVLEASRSTNRLEQMLLWGIGVVLVIHVFNWFGMVYFDQTINVFYIQLAFLSTLSQRRTRERLHSISARTLNRSMSAQQLPVTQSARGHSNGHDYQKAPDIQVRRPTC